MHGIIVGAARLAAFAVCLFGGAASVQAQPDNPVLPNLVVTVLEKHLAVIDHRHTALGRAYGPNAASLTVIAAFRKAGVSERTIEQYAHAWSGAGLVSDYLWAVSYYNRHADALRASIAHVRQRASVGRDELLRIDRGMEVWKANEDELRALFAARVRLHVQSGKAVDLDYNAENMPCSGDVPACRHRKDRLKAEAKQMSAGLDFGENRDTIQRVAALVAFDAIAAGPPLPDCSEMTVSYEPGRLTHGQLARPKLAYAPADCRPQERPAFRLAEAGAPFDLDARTGTIRKSDNARGDAKIEAILKTRKGDLVANATVIGDAAAPCTGLDWTYVDQRIHLRAWGVMQLDFTPKDCSPWNAPVTITADRPNVLWIEDDASRVRNLFGLAEGITQVTASSGTMRAPLLSIHVVNEGKPCESIQLSYWRTELRVGTHRLATPGGRGPKLTYKPESCKQPDGPPRFSLLNQNDAAVLALDAATGAIEGLKAGTAKVIVGHGNLPGNVVDITVLDRPACDGLVVTLTRNPLRVGEEAQAEWRAVNATGGISTDDPDSHMCTSPQTRMSYASDNTAAAPIDDRGIIKGVAPGSALIELKLGGISGRTEAKVRP